MHVPLNVKQSNILEDLNLEQHDTEYHKSCIVLILLIMAYP